MTSASEEVHAGDEHLRDGEGDRVEQVGGPVEPQAQVLGDAADLGPVVEGHHDDAEEDHRGDGPDPVVVQRHEPVLGTVGGHPDDFEGAEVRRDERETGDPGRQRPAGQEEVDAGADRAAGCEADPENRHEVQCDEQIVDGVEAQAETVGGKCVHHGRVHTRECDSENRGPLQPAGPPYRPAGAECLTAVAGRVSPRGEWNSRGYSYRPKCP
jgi:hypothetical protein